MNDLPLSPEQSAIISAPLDQHIFLFGPAGAGKTTAAVKRLRYLVDCGIPGSSILILTPQRTLASPYYDEIFGIEFPAGGQPNIITVGGLSQRFIRLFWPMIARQAGFRHPTRPPTFLTFETAQYFMHRLTQPLISSGYFESVTLDLNRIYTQILDNLNKSAIVGFPFEEIGQRLQWAQSEIPNQPRLFADAQECAIQFRQFCLQNNLLDYSLQIEVFYKHLWRSVLCQKYFYNLYQHLIFDNVEEDVPITHDLVREWLPQFQSSLLIYDTEAGFRTFLGADPDSGWELNKIANSIAEFSPNRVANHELLRFSQNLSAQIRHLKPSSLSQPPQENVEITQHRFLPQMADWVARSIDALVHDDHVSESEIVVLVPFLSDTLDFYLTNQLRQRGIACASRRPSRSLQGEPFTRCILTLAKLAHPHWKCSVSLLELRSAMLQLFRGVDLVRVDLLCRIVARLQKNTFGFTSFNAIRPEVQKRLTAQLGEKYTSFVSWLSDYQTNPADALDVFVSRLFTDLLMQPEFGLDNDFDAINQVSRLLESIQKFQQAYASIQPAGDAPIGLEYIQAVELGLISAQYIAEWVRRPENSVMIAPAFTFLMENRPVDYQFWLDIGSPGWWERLYQPLTHPIVLSRRWQPGHIWGDADEMGFAEVQLSRITHGLTLRCRKKVFMGYLMLDQRGSEQRGMFLSALRQVFKTSPNRSGNGV